jgi:hypothetical protein
MGRLVAICLVVMGIAGLAHAEGTAGVLQGFGLIGTWAPDCSQPASRDNIQSIYSLSGADVILTHDGGANASKDSYAVRTAKLVGTDSLLIQVRSLDMPPEMAAEAELSITLRKVGPKVQIWKQTAPGGIVLTEDGRIPATGTSTLPMSHCR